MNKPIPQRTLTGSRTTSGTRTRTSAETAAKFEEQLGFIRRSTALYDEGHVAEADRLALSFRILFHNGGQSHSLLNQLGMEKVNLRSGFDLRISGGPTFNCLASVQISLVPEVKAIPILNNTEVWWLVRSSKWWEEEVVVRIAGVELTRRDIAKDVADSDGGAHVDPHVYLEMEALQKFGGFAMTLSPGDNGPEVTAEMRDMHRACLRQMAYEFLESPAIRRFDQGTLAGNSEHHRR